MITDILLGLDVNELTEEKGKFTYLSWALAWREVLKVYSKATYNVIKNEKMECWFGDSKKGYMVYTNVTIDGITKEMWLPVMNSYNKSILEPSTTDINKSVMRCLVKNLAMFGLGLYIYAGEDLPEIEPKEITLKDLKELCTTVNYEIDKFIVAYNGHSEIKIKKLEELPKENIKLYYTWLQGKVK